MHNTCKTAACSAPTRSSKLTALSPGPLRRKASAAYTDAASKNLREANDQMNTCSNRLCVCMCMCMTWHALKGTCTSRVLKVHKCMGCRL